MNIINIKAPRLNSNDDELLILEIYVKKGEKIAKGTKLLLVETSKTAVDIESEFEGTLVEIKVKKGNYVSVDHEILSLKVDDVQSAPKKTDNNNPQNQETKQSRISLKALKLIEEKKINIKDLDYIKSEIKYQRFAPINHYQQILSYDIP